MSLSNKVIVLCSYCGQKVEKFKSKLRNSRHNIYFCNRLCKEKAQQIGGLKIIQPSHYKDGRASYRKRAFRVLENKCSVCGYSIKEVLEVHHKDNDRKNNKISNLDILCPTHHIEYQCGIRKYEGL